MIKKPSARWRNGKNRKRSKGKAEYNNITLWEDTSAETRRSTKQKRHSHHGTKARLTYNGRTRQTARTRKPRKRPMRRTKRDRNTRRRAQTETRIAALQYEKTRSFGWRQRQQGRHKKCRRSEAKMPKKWGAWTPKYDRKHTKQNEMCENNSDRKWAEAKKNERLPTASRENPC